MELLPIFRTSLILFMIVMSGIVSISYIMYKIKSLDKEQNRSKKSGEPERTPVQQMMVPVPVQREQSSNISRRAVQQKQRIQVKPRERFLIVNQQQADIRIYQTEAVIDAPFYHPRKEENNRQFLSRKPFDLFENYSTGGEKLHRLHVA